MRYAIYFTPPKDDPLTQVAAIWLGRNAFHSGALAVPADTGLAEGEWQTITADPRRYGFHATLKAPFRLADGETEAGLLAAVDRFAASATAFDLAALTVAGLGPFFALVPADEEPELQDFAARVVKQFEAFRAPLSEADLARRKPEKLSEQQRDYLSRYGYPYVREEFRFHMTLTGPVADERRADLYDLLERWFADFTHKPRRIDALTVFVEPQPGAPFRVLHRAPLSDRANQQAFA